MATSADLVTLATTLSTAANALAATAIAVEALVTALKGGQIIDQPTLDAVTTSLQSSVTSIDASQKAIQNLIPATPAA